MGYVTISLPCGADGKPYVIYDGRWWDEYYAKLQEKEMAEHPELYEDRF